MISDKNHGFTLIEMIAVLIILGVISTVILSRVPSVSDYEMRGELDTLKGHVRYAQACAMGSNSTWKLDILSSSSYSLVNADALNVYFPATESYIVTLEALNISSISGPAPPGAVSFDGFGSPGSSDVLIETSSGNFTITANTGYLQ